MDGGNAAVGPLVAVIARGRNRLSVELRDAVDRLIASDPGGTSLRRALRAVVAVATTLLLELAVGTLLGQPPLLLMMIGAVVTLTLSTTVRENHRRAIARTAAGALVSVSVGTTLAVLVDRWLLVSLAVFVAVSYVAVWVRRFGPRWFVFGFMGWQTYFMCLFLKPPPAALPLLLLAIIVAVFWTALLLLTVFWEEPAKRLGRTVTALRARARATVSATVDVLDDPGEESRVRRLRAQLVRLSEVALLFDGQLAEARALPPGVSPSRLRRWVVEVEIAMDGLADAAVVLAEHAERLTDAERDAVHRTLQLLGWGEYAPAEEAARRLAEQADRAAPATELRGLAEAALALLQTIEEWTSGRLLTAEEAGPEREGFNAEEIEALRGFRDGEFETVVTLFSGSLPGSAPVASHVVVRAEAPLWSPAGWRLTTRQAVQAASAAALAIVAGELISPQRYYWAVIAAFIVFTGTATTDETIRKSIGRIVGTALGLVAAVGLANQTHGHPIVALILIIVSIFVGFYLQQISQAAMIFCITILLGQMYGLLGTFSEGLLMLRLEETVVGGLIGALTAMLVLRAGTRETLRQARREFLTVLGDLLIECADRLSGGAPTRDLVATIVRMDDSARQIARSSRNLIRGRVFGSGREGVRHRVAVLGLCSAAGRAIASLVFIGSRTEQAGGRPAEICRLLAQECERLAEIRELGLQPPRPLSTPDLPRQALGLLEDDRELAHSPIGLQLHRLTDALNLLTPRGRKS